MNNKIIKEFYSAAAQRNYEAVKKHFELYITVEETPNGKFFYVYNSEEKINTEDGYVYFAINVSDLIAFFTGLLKAANNVFKKVEK